MLLLSRSGAIAGAAVAVVLLAAGAALAGHKATPRIPAHTYIDLQPGVPPVPDVPFNNAPAARLVHSWSSTLVRQRGNPIGGTMPSPFQVDPYLATSWRRDATGNLILNLRKNAKSPTGNTFTAKDVIYSFERGIAIDASTAGNALANANFDLKNPVTAINDYTVRLNQTAPSALTLGLLGAPSVGSSICCFDSTEMKKHATERDPWSRTWLAAGNSATYGPYYVSGFQPNTSIELKWNPRFFGKKPYFTRVIIKANTDSSVRMQLMLTGYASHTAGLDWSQFVAVKRQSKAKGLTAYALQQGTEAMMLNQLYKPFQDARVRQALSLALDRQAISRSIWAGYGTPEWRAVPSWIPLPFKPTLLKDNNIDRAKQLLAQAGYPNGFGFTLSAAITSGDYISDEMALIQSQLARVGVNVSINVISTSAEFGSKRTNRQLQAYINQGGPGGAADIGNWIAFIYKAQLPLEGYQSAKIQSTINTMLGNGAGARRERAMASAYKIWEADVPRILMVNAVWQTISDSSITGYKQYTYPVTFYENLTRTK
jgi:peptide/nickel transport system substrate-binding protein